MEASKSQSKQISNVCARITRENTNRELTPFARTDGVDRQSPSFENLYVARKWASEPLEETPGE